MTTDEWPPLLDILDSDPVAAHEEFYTFTSTALKERPPRLLKLWIDRKCGESLEEFVFELLYHCCKNNFAKLRAYRRIEKRLFERWLLTVANRLIVDQLRKHANRPLPPFSTPRTPPLPLPPALINAMRECIESFPEYRQVLINARFMKGMPPRDIARVLGLKDDEVTRKKISADSLHALTILQQCVASKLPRGAESFQRWLGKYKNL